ncbi:MAG: glycogen synthase GlgA [Acidobacteria bacterium]|nr:glycogen synthase GlgA [Acidobacteriota bacterium]
MEPLKICWVSSEMAPYAKTGGLADVAEALPAYLGSQGHDVRTFLPLYGRIDTSQGFTVVEWMVDRPLRLGGRTFHYTLVTDSAPGDHLQRFFIHCPALFGREAIYTGDSDEAIRFAFLAKAAIECCQGMGWAPDVFHCNDWHTGLLPLYLRHHYGWDRLFERSKTLLTIHNLGYQGMFPTSQLGALDLQGCAHLLYRDDLDAGVVGFLKTGFLYADLLSTVSRTYAREIQTPEYGMGLDGVLRARADHLVGIVNGVDYALWDPATDRHLPYHYSAEDLTGKLENQRYLLQATGLDAEPSEAVFGLVSRLTAQKGLDLLFEPLQEMLAGRDVRLVVLGSGESRYEAYFARLAQAFPRKAFFYRGYNERLAHLIEAGADAFLMPSRYEPCGLNQMYSLRYGTVPIVRKTGGLADTVQLFDPATGEGTGVVFEHQNADAVRWALTFALRLFGEPEAWRRMVTNGMAQDYSWQVQGARYEALYRAMANL